VAARGRDLDEAVAGVTGVALSDEARVVGERQRECARPFERQAEIQCQARIAARARPMLLEEPADIGNEIPRGCCHTEPLIR